MVHNGGGMASKGLRSDVPINRDERLMRVMTFATTETLIGYTACYALYFI
jgi:hypothetical protein